MEIEQRLPFDFVPVYTESVHVPTVADEHLQLAVCQFPGLHTDKGMPQLIQSDARADTVSILILLPPAFERALARNLKQRGIVVELYAGIFQELHLRFVGLPRLLAHIK